MAAIDKAYTQLTRAIFIATSELLVVAVYLRKKLLEEKISTREIQTRILSAHNKKDNNKKILIQKYNKIMTIIENIGRAKNTEEIKNKLNKQENYDDLNQKRHKLSFWVCTPCSAGKFKKAVKIIGRKFKDLLDPPEESAEEPVVSVHG